MFFNSPSKYGTLRQQSAFDKLVMWRHLVTTMKLTADRLAADKD